jgi:hypothetical protein
LSLDILSFLKDTLIALTQPFPIVVALVDCKTSVFDDPFLAIVPADPNDDLEKMLNFSLLPVINHKSNP